MVSRSSLPWILSCLIMWLNSKTAALPTAVAMIWAASSNLNYILMQLYESMSLKQLPPGHVLSCIGLKD